MAIELMSTARLTRSSRVNLLSFCMKGSTADSLRALWDNGFRLVFSALENKN